MIIRELHSSTRLAFLTCRVKQVAIVLPSLSPRGILITYLLLQPKPSLRPHALAPFANVAMQPCGFAFEFGHERDVPTRGSQHHFDPNHSRLSCECAANSLWAHFQYSARGRIVSCEDELPGARASSRNPGFPLNPGTVHDERLESNDCRFGTRKLKRNFRLAPPTAKWQPPPTAAASSSKHFQGLDLEFRLRFENTKSEPKIPDFLR